MLSVLIFAVVIITVYGERKNFTPKRLDIRDQNPNRIWLHLSPKCFAAESDVRVFKDYLLSKYDCISYNTERKKIYKHVKTANYSVWSLWLEKSADLKCLDTMVDLPHNVLPQCIEGVYIEPMEHVTQNPFCDSLGTGGQLDMWSLDWLDGVKNDVFRYPSYGRTEVEAIILDTDVDADHIEFLGLDATNLYTGTLPPTTSQDHGTHVSGTVVGHNVGGSFDVDLRYYPVCRQGGSCSWADIEDGYETTIAYMASGPSTRRYVINYSVGGGRTASNEAAYNDWGARMTAVGGIWVTSAGNNNQNACNYAPSFTTWAVTVGAYDVNTQAAFFSNYGACTDAWGPGVLVESAAPGNEYSKMSGTSMSSPNIASLAVKLLKRFPGITLDDIKDYMLDNARNVCCGGGGALMNQVYLDCTYEEWFKKRGFA